GLASVAPWGGAAGVVRLPGVHAPLGAEPPGHGVRAATLDGEGAVAGQAERGGGDAAQAPPRPPRPARPVAEPGGAGVLRLPRRPGEHGGSGGVPVGRHPSLAPGVATPRPAGPPELAALPAAGGLLAAATQDPASLSDRALRREAPEIRAGC